MLHSVAHPERVLNLHFLMPPHVNPVELMSCGATDQAVIDGLMELLPRYGLSPFEVHAESVGFIFDRIWAAIKRESLMVVADRGHMGVKSGRGFYDDYNSVPAR
jgi:3-hydroxybutyryl-CoA dehydrogenase